MSELSSLILVNRPAVAGSAPGFGGKTSASEVLAVVFGQKWRPRRLQLRRERRSSNPKDLGIRQHLRLMSDVREPQAYRPDAALAIAR
jgi:hypothetical protein